jgi:4-amino-4-deoxy-L-arabinose transferase-like glycosyltransferase
MADATTAVRGVGRRVRARARTDRFIVPLAAIAVLALAVRLVETLVLRAGNKPDQDAYYYWTQGHALAVGEGFIDAVRLSFLQGVYPSAYHPPLFGMFLAAVDWLGFDTVDSNRVACCLLSVGSVILIAYTARRIAGPRAGLIAAILAAIYPPLWVSDAMLLSETMVIFVVAFTLLVTYRFRERPSIPFAIAMGVGTALCAMTRTELILLFPIVVVPFVLSPRVGSWSRRLRMLGAAALAVVVLVGPWVGYNMSRFHHPEFIATGTGAALMSGSCHRVWYGSYIGYWTNCEQIPPKGGDESDDDVWYRQRSLDFWEHHVTRVPLVVAARVGRLWNVFKPVQQVHFTGGIEEQGDATAWFSLAGYVILMPLAIWGLFLLRRRGVAILPLLALAGIVSLSAATTSGVQRYRTPADVAIVLSAAVAIEVALGRLVAKPSFAGLRRPWAFLAGPEPGPPPAAPEPEPAAV